MSIPQASAGPIPQTLFRFLDVVGAGTISGPRMVPSPWSKLPQYRWTLTRFAEIERVAAMLSPHCDIVKREQMRVRLDHVRAVRARRRTA